MAARMSFGVCVGQRRYAQVCRKISKSIFLRRRAETEGHSIVLSAFGDPHPELKALRKTVLKGVLRRVRSSVEEEGEDPDVLVLAQERVVH